MGAGAGVSVQGNTGWSGPLHCSGGSSVGAGVGLVAEGVWVGMGIKDVEGGVALGATGVAVGVGPIRVLVGRGVARGEEIGVAV